MHEILQKKLDLAPPALEYLLGLLKGQPIPSPTLDAEGWDNFIKVCAGQGLLPWLFTQANPLPAVQKPPADIINKMREAFWATASSSIKKEFALKKVLAALNQAEIEALVLKGLAHAFALYPVPAARPFGDLDLLILPDQVLKSRTILLELGYQCCAAQFDNLSQIEIEDKYFHAVEPHKMPMVEIHWRLHAFSRPIREKDTREYFNRKIAVQTPTTQFFALHPVDAFLHAALHQTMTHHQELRLTWVLDLAYLAQKITQLNAWPELVDEAEKLQVIQPARCAVELAERWTGLKLPAEFADARRWPTPTRAAQRAWQDAVTRQTSLWKWWKARWPKNLNPWQHACLLVNVIKHKVLQR